MVLGWSPSKCWYVIFLSNLEVKLILSNQWILLRLALNINQSINVIPSAIFMLWFQYFFTNSIINLPNILSQNNSRAHNSLFVRMLYNQPIIHVRFWLGLSLICLSDNLLLTTYSSYFIKSSCHITNNQSALSLQNPKALKNMAVLWMSRELTNVFDSLPVMTLYRMLLKC